MEATGSNPTAKETLLPSRDNADELVALIEDGCTSIMRSAADFKAQGQFPYINMYTAITRYLIGNKGQQRGNVTSRGEDLVPVLRRVLTNHLTEAFSKHPTQDTPAFVEFYACEWRHYVESAKLLDRVFLYFHRHHILREKDEGNVAILNVYDYCMCIWRKRVVGAFHEGITEGCVKKLVMGSSDVDVSAVATVRDSLVAMRFVNPETADAENAVYEAYLTQPILAAVRLDAARGLHERDGMKGSETMDQRRSAMKARFEACLLPATVDILLQTYDDAAGLNEQGAKAADNDA